MNGLGLQLLGQFVGCYINPWITGLNQVYYFYPKHRCFRVFFLSPLF